MIKGENKKEELFQAALTLFAQNGFENTGTTDIINAVGVTKPTLYYFFNNKEGILVEILERYYKPFISELTKCTVYEPDPANYEKDIYPVLLKVVLCCFENARNNPEFSALMLSFFYAPAGLPSTRISLPYRQSYAKVFVDMFDSMAEQHGNLRGKSLHNGRYLAAMINWEIVLYRQGQSALDKAEAESIVRMLLHGALAG